MVIIRLWLQVLYMSHNLVREWREFEHMSELPYLEDLVFIGNPLEEEQNVAGRYTEEVIKRLLYLKKLDGFPVIRQVHCKPLIRQPFVPKEIYFVSISRLTVSKKMVHLGFEILGMVDVLQSVRPIC